MQRVGERPAIRVHPGRLALPVLLCLAPACSEPQQPVEIPFSARFGHVPIDCTTPAGDIHLTDLRLFVHEFRLLTRDGDAVPLELRDEAPWQGGQVALLDFESGASACRNGSAATNTTVRGSVKPGDFIGLAFRIGVPESLNHGDPLQAMAPLNISAMHWHWLTGYKFLRAGIADSDDGFWIHLGSTHCEGTVTEPRGCGHSNRPQVVLPAFVPGESRVVLDLQALANAVDLQDGVATDCSSGPAEAACERPFAALGLEFASGEESGTPGLVRVARVE